MGYVGNAPAEKYTTIDKQTLTGNNTVGPYTLTHSVGNEQEIEVFVNNVRQEPGVSYTVSSNQLTMSASVASADDFYVIFQGKAKMTATHPPTFDLTAANGTFTGTVTTGGLTVGSDTAKTKFYSNSTYNGIYNGSALTNNESIYMGSGTLFFYSGGGERMRIDSSGNVGIGTSNTTSGKTTINLTGVAVAGDTDGATIGSSGIINLYNSNATTNSTVMLLGGGSDLVVGQIASGIGFTRENSGNWGTQLRFYTHSTATSDLDELKERMRIDSSGRVGIGTAPASVLHVQGADPTVTIQDTNDTGDAFIKFKNNSGTQRGFIQTAMTSNVMLFGTGTTERMRIDSSGNLLVGTTNTDPAFNNVTGQSMASTGQLQVTRDGGVAALFNRKTSDGDVVQFRKDGGTVGSIGTPFGGSLYISGGGANGASLVFQNNDNITPARAGARADNTLDLGNGTFRFKDLYLSGGVVFGATGGAVTGKTLDDYEEGNWTPQFGGSSTTGTGTYTTTVGRYVKVGKKVNCWGIIVSSGTHNGTGTLQIHGLPFTKENTYLSWGTETNIAYHFGFTSYGSFTNVIRLLGPVSNGTYIRFHSFGNTGDTSVPPTPANVQSGTSVYFSATYEVQ